MKKQLITLVTFVAIPLLSFAQTANEIIDKNIAALGGADKLAAIKSFKFDQKLSIMGMDMTGKTTVVVDKSIRNDVSAMGQQMTTVVDGDKGWSINPMSGGTTPQPLPEDQLKMQKGNMHLFGTDLAVAKAKKYPIELVGKEKIDNKDAFNLKVTRPEGEANYYVDATTYQLAGMKAKVSVQGQSGEIKIKYSNYQTLEGLTLPTSLDLENPSMPGSLTLTVSNVALNPTVDPAIFAMPK
ncbi:LolA family protein [Spirosoma daeguense]